MSDLIVDVWDGLNSANIDPEYERDARSQAILNVFAQSTARAYWALANGQTLYTIETIARLHGFPCVIPDRSRMANFEDVIVWRLPCGKLHIIYSNGAKDGQLLILGPVESYKPWSQEDKDALVQKAKEAQA